MNGISHKQAQRYLRMDLDGLLSEAQRLDLETHLRACAACRLDSESFSRLTTRLQAEFHSRWDLRQAGPSQSVLANIHAKSRRIMMQKRIDFAFNIFGAMLTLLVLFFVVTSVISQFQRKSTTANGTQTSLPASVPKEERLLAFTSRQSGNYEIYTVLSDGSDVRNITNNPADDVNPYWSPDGKHIAFQSNRNSKYYSQIFLMDADGSNVVLLTTDRGNHELPLNMDGKTNPWSPDGSKLLLLRQGLSEGEWILQSIDINTRNITSLATERSFFSNISWSPDGKYIGFVLNAPRGKFIPQIHVVRADGSNLINISSLLPSEENVDPPYYYWSRDGESISFITWTASEPATHENDTSKLYEASVDGSLTLQATTHSPIGSLWNGIYFIRPTMGSGSWTWVYPDGSTNTINPTKECEQEPLYDSSTNSYTSAVANFSRSPNGNGVIIASCPDGNIHLSWVNSTGTEITPIAKLSTAPAVGYVDWVQWSIDGKFVALHLPETNPTDAYLVNITESLKDPSIPPVKISLDGSEFPYLPAWQPVSPIGNEDITEKSPTPEPEKTSSHDGLIAFTSERDGNLEIYTMRADGSELTNITNDPGRDMDPVWSPDGKHIAFLSDRGGSENLQIYSMDSDGTNLIRLTNTPDTEWWAGMDWSPDGQYLVVQHFPMEAEQTTPGKGHVNLYLINANGSGATQLTENESGGDHSAQWSPKGDLIAFLHTESNLTQIYTIHPDGTGLFKLSNNERNDSAFNWSPDGTRINYISSPIHCSPPDHCPRNEIWSIRADGTDHITLLAFPAPDVTLDQTDWIPDRIAWSPDGTRLVSVTWDSPPGSAGNSYLSILSPFSNADAIQKKIPGHIAQAYWSPDGLFFTYSSDVSGNWDIYTLRVTDVLQNPDAEPLQITSSPAADTSPAWQPIP